MTYIPTSNLNYGAQLDSGNRLRVSQLTCLLDIKQLNNDAPLFIDRENISGATQTWSPSGTTVMSVTSSGDAAIAQTKMFAPYFSGKGQLIEITFDDYQNESNVTKRVGYFSSDTTTPYDNHKDGIWFEADGSDYRLIIQKSGDTILNVTQSSWNLDTASWFDPSKFNVLVIQFLYLGGTAVKLGFFNDGDIRWVHKYVHAGISNGTFIISPNQPVRYEIRSSGGTGSCEQICCQVASEGSIDRIGIQRSVNLNGAALDANSVGTKYALLGIRLKPTHRNIRVEETEFNMIALTNDDFLWEIHLNPTVAGTFTYADVDETSSFQAASGDTVSNPSTNTVTNGILLYSGLGQGGSISTPYLNSAIRVGSTIDGTMDEIVLSVSPLSVNLDITATLNLREFL